MTNTAYIFTLLLVFSVNTMVANAPEDRNEEYQMSIDRIERLSELAGKNITRDADLAVVLYDSILELSTKLAFNKGIRRGHLGKGAVAFYNGRPKESLIPYQKALDISLKSKDANDIAICYYNLGLSHQELSDFTKAIDAYENAFLNLPDNKSVVGVAISAGLGEVYEILELYEPAYKYANRALELALEMDAEDLIAKRRVYMAKVLNKLDKHEEAITEFSVAKEILETKDEPYVLTLLHIGLSESYLDLGMIKQSKSAMDEAFGLIKRNNLEGLKTRAHLQLGKTLLASRQKKEAIWQLSQALEISKKQSNKIINAQAAKLLSEIYEGLGDESKSFAYLKAYSNLRDSLELDKQIKNLAALSSQYQNQVHEKKIVEQQLLLKQQENRLLQKERSNMRLLVVALGLIFILIVCFAAYFHIHKVRRKEDRHKEMEQNLLVLDGIMRGEESERRRLAEDLHDGISCDLVILKMRLSKVLAKNNVNYEQEIRKSQEFIDQIIDNVRNVSHNLMPSSLNKMSLYESLAGFCLKLNNSTPLNVHFNCINTLPEFHRGSKISIYRIVQEIVNNALQHSRAENVIVQLENNGKELALVIEDDGEGFDPEEIFLGIGLKNVKSRVDFLKGKMEIESDEEGSVFTFRFNLETIHKIHPKIRVSSKESSLWNQELVNAS